MTLPTRPSEVATMGLPGPSRRVTVTPEPVTVPPPSEPDKTPDPVPVEPEKVPA